MTIITWYHANIMTMMMMMMMKRTFLLWLLLLLLICSSTTTTTTATTTASSKNTHQEVDYYCQEGDDESSSSSCPAPPCVDLVDDCKSLFHQNQCLESPAYMVKHCSQTCGFCKIKTERNNKKNNGEEEEDDDEDFENRDWFLDMGVPQKLNNADLDDFHNVYADAIIHLLSVASSDSLYIMLDHCKNLHNMCIQWAMAGNCNDNGVHNEHFMNTKCCPACQAAAQLFFLQQCPIHENDYTAFAQPGDVTKHFERILAEFPQYNPTVLSRPLSYDIHNNNNDDNTDANYKMDGPWIITLDNVATEQEMDRLIHWGHTLGYERSTDGGDSELDGSWEAVETDDRTSMETFCTDGCFEDPVIQTLMERIENVTGIPQDHSDYLQLLYYEEGQFYKTHQDYHSHQVFSSTGARILTFYMYLNDVQHGGGTNFPYLDLTVLPKRGRVLMWSNVQDEDPNEEHLLARHQALPVGMGSVKYGATAWFHHRDYKNNDPDLCGR